MQSKRLKGKAYRDVAEAEAKEKKTVRSKSGKAKPHKGTIVEVVIPIVPKRKVSPKIKATSSANSDTIQWRILELEP